MFPRKRRTNNYNSKFYMLHLINVVGRKIPYFPPKKYINAGICDMQGVRAVVWHRINTALASAFHILVAHCRLQLCACVSPQLLQFCSLSRCIQKVRMTFTWRKKKTQLLKPFSLRLTSSNFMSISSVDCSSWKYKPPIIIASCLKKSKSGKTRRGLLCDSFRLQNHGIIIGASGHTNEDLTITYETILNKFGEKSPKTEIIMNVNSVNVCVYKQLGA